MSPSTLSPTRSARISSAQNPPRPRLSVNQVPRLVATRARRRWRRLRRATRTGVATTEPVWRAVSEPAGQSLGVLQHRAELGGRLAGPVPSIGGPPDLAQRLREVGVPEPALHEHCLHAAEAFLEIAEVLVHG